MVVFVSCGYTQSGALAPEVFLATPRIDQLFGYAFLTFSYLLMLVPSILIIIAPHQREKFGTLHEFACHPCAGAMLIFSVSFQF